MSLIDLKIFAVVLGTIGLFTLVANIIPQVESEAPAEIAFGAEVTTEELLEAGEQLFRGAGGCTACHAESAGARAPNLVTDYQGQGPIGVRCTERVPGLSCKEFLHQSLVQPAAHMVDDYPPIMPSVERTMSQPQIWALVAYLESMGGEVTVTGADIPDEAPAQGTAGPEGAPAAAGVAATEPAEIIRELCFMCHTLEGEGTELGPSFDGVGSRLTSEQLRMAILDPPSVVSEGYEDFVGLMPTTFGAQLTAGQFESLVRYLSDLR